MRRDLIIAVLLLFVALPVQQSLAGVGFGFHGNVTNFKIGGEVGKLLGTSSGGSTTTLALEEVYKLGLGGGLHRAGRVEQQVLVRRRQPADRPPVSTDPARVAAVAANESLVFPTGALTPAQLRWLFTVLPLDLTFVDADDRVRYFSEGPDRVFARSKAILGRLVQHCHPPKSVHIVEQILDDFKAGRHSVAEFWIPLHGRFVHIRYFAMRDQAGFNRSCANAAKRPELRTCSRNRAVAPGRSTRRSSLRVRRSPSSPR